MSYYDGIKSFRGYLQRIFGNQTPGYDWADLAPWERQRYAERDAVKRERRKDKR